MPSFATPPVYKDGHYAGLSAIIIRPAIIVRGPSYHNTSCYHCAGLCICFAGLSAIIIREFCICFMDLLLLCSVSAIIMQCFCYYYAVFQYLLYYIVHSVMQDPKISDLVSDFFRENILQNQWWCLQECCSGRGLHP